MTFKTLTIIKMHDLFLLNLTPQLVLNTLLPKFRKEIEHATQWAKEGEGRTLNGYYLGLKKK